jgi:hypothetical protein
MDSVAARVDSETALRLAATSGPRSTFRSARRTHVDDMAVDRLAAAMKERFITLREPGCDWDDPRKFSPELLAKMLGEAVCTGDAVLVGVIAAMILTRNADHQVIAEHAMRAFLQGSCHDQSQRITELQQKLAAATQEACA